MRKRNYILLGCPIVFFALTFVSSAFAEEYTVEMRETGFNHTVLEISDGDVITFVNTHMKTNGNLEPHAISDPFAVPYTEASYWILDNNYQSHSYTLDCSGHVFYDRFIIPNPSIEISCGENQTTNNSNEDTNTPPEYTDTYDLVSIQSELMQVTADLTAAVEVISLLQQEVIDLNAEITVLESYEFDTTPYENQIASLESQVSALTSEKTAVEADRDAWQTLSDGWYSVAMEQLRIMVDVLGI